MAILRRSSLLLLVLLSGCGKPPSLLGRVDDIVGVQGEYFPKSEDQRIPFKGGAADGQAIARILLQGTSHEPYKWRGRGYFSLTYADGRSQSIEVFKPGSVVGIGGHQYQIKMDELVAHLERLSAQK